MIKKIFLLLIALSFFLCGCRTVGPYTNFTAIKKPVPETPSFLIFDENEGKDSSWLANGIEDTLIGKGLTVISKPVIIRKTGDYSRFNWWIGRETGQQTTSINTINLNQTPATYAIMINSTYWEFRIIKTQTHELTAKGYFSRDWAREILIVLKEMGIPLELPPPDPPQKNFWQRLLLSDETK